MTKANLHPDQRRTVEIIEALGFGAIAGLSVHLGLSCYQPEPRIVQSINLDLAPEGQPERTDAELTLKVEFECLFDQLSQLREGVVDVEVRHGAPSRLVVRRCYKELAR